MDRDPELALLLDRQAIMDCLTRYTRGVDRLDRALLVSAYHPDAIDDHGIFVGGPEEFADWALAYHREHQIATNHLLSNHRCEIDGDTAHAETYCTYVGVNRDGTIDVIGNRYVDRLEKRDGRWAILRRVCTVEWVAAMTPAEMAGQMKDAMAAMMSNAPNTRDRSDISYARPLDITRMG
jgi:hypothetical protein